MLCFALLCFALFFSTLCGSASKTFWSASQTTAQTQMVWEGWLSLTQSQMESSWDWDQKRYGEKRDLLGDGNKVKKVKDNTSQGGMIPWTSCGIIQSCCSSEVRALSVLVTEHDYSVLVLVWGSSLEVLFVLDNQSKIFTTLKAVEMM